MKPKKIPRIAKIWLILLGIWGGSLASTVLTVLVAYGGSMIAFYIQATLILGSVLALYFIGWKYKKTLEETGIFNITEKIKERIKEK